MIKNNGTHVIVSYAYGGFSACACTWENAKNLMEQHLERHQDLQALAQVIRTKATSEGKKALVYLSETLAAALHEVATLDDGANAPALRVLFYGPAPTIRSGTPDTRPMAVVDLAMKTELVMWAFNKSVDPHKFKNMSEEKLKETQAHLELSFLAPFRERHQLDETVELILVNQTDYSNARELNQLRHGTWKEDAEEHKVVGRYLQLIRDVLGGRDDSNIDVVKIDDTP